MRKPRKSRARIGAKRGRPPKPRPSDALPLRIVADVLQVPIDALERGLAAAPASFFVGATKQGEQWMIPATSLKPWLGAGSLPLLTRADVATALKLPRATVCRMVRMRQIASVSVAGRVRIQPQAIAALLHHAPAAPLFSQEGQV